MLLAMTNHRSVDARIAGQVRAELARKKGTAGELARVLGVTAHTAGRRLAGRTSFTVAELVLVADWLGVDVADLIGSPAEAAAS